MVAFNYFSDLCICYIVIYDYIIVNVFSSTFSHICGQIYNEVTQNIVEFYFSTFSAKTGQI